MNTACFITEYVCVCVCPCLTNTVKHVKHLASIISGTSGKYTES